jgi:hypothetical protein
LKHARNLRGIFEGLRGKRSNLARIGEKWRQKALDASRTEGSNKLFNIMNAAKLETCSGHGAAWSGGGVEFIKQ